MEILSWRTFCLTNLSNWNNSVKLSGPGYCLRLSSARWRSGQQRPGRGCRPAGRGKCLTIYEAKCQKRWFYNGSERAPGTDFICAWDIWLSHLNMKTAPFVSTGIYRDPIEGRRQPKFSGLLLLASISKAESKAGVKMLQLNISFRQELWVTNFA